MRVDVNVELDPWAYRRLARIAGRRGLTVEEVARRLLIPALSPEAAAFEAAGVMHVSFPDDRPSP